jgi:hypothetical protein
VVGTETGGRSWLPSDITNDVITVVDKCQDRLNALYQTQLDVGQEQRDNDVVNDITVWSKTELFEDLEHLAERIKQVLGIETP